MLLSIIHQLISQVTEVQQKQLTRVHKGSHHDQRIARMSETCQPDVTWLVLNRCHSRRKELVRPVLSHLYILIRETEQNKRQSHFERCAGGLRAAWVVSYDTESGLWQQNFWRAKCKTHAPWVFLAQWAAILCTARIHQNSMQPSSLVVEDLTQPLPGTVLLRKPFRQYSYQW